MRLICILYSLLVLLASSTSWADVCITGYGGGLSAMNAELEFETQNLAFTDSSFQLHTAARSAPKCKELEAFSFGLEAMSLTLTTSAIAAGCSGVGLVATAGLQGLAVGLSFINMVITHMPCDESVPEAQIKQMVVEEVCSVLKQSQIECNLTPLDISEKQRFL